MTRVSVHIPAQIGQVYGAQRWEAVEADTLAALIKTLDARFPGIGERLIEPDGRMRRWINVFVNGEDIQALGGMATRLPENAEVYIIPAVAGG